MHSYNGSLLDFLKLRRERLILSVLKLSASPELCEAGNDEVANLVELRVARDEEHVSSDAVLDHGLAGDTVVAKGQEDPGDVSLDDAVVY